ncbi:MAG TPA: hypothetical protein VJM12_10340 [Pyrinomonadaceae bacterium]|nr:hypothetical protein [Pyrinomonadaceae bacterium]
MKLILSLSLSLTLISTGDLNRPSKTHTTQHIRQSTIDHTRERRIFQRAKELLEQKGVPFDVEQLLQPDWRKRLAPAFAQMKEMQVERRLGKQLAGVQLADTLYLPEHVELTEDTVIIARLIVHEGSNAVIKGSHDIFVYAIGTWGLLGTTLETARRKAKQEQQPDLPLVQVGYKGPNAATRLVPRLIQGGRITVITDGEGYKEWLEKQKNQTVARVGFIKAAYRVPLQNNTDGSHGEQGPTGMIGSTGAPGSPDPSLPGDNGDCSGSGVNGLQGFPGANGGTGGIGGAGGQGFTGGPAGNQSHHIQTIGGFYTFSAKGGGGGKGGTGGSGGVGGQAAQGGHGGTGASCSCPPGNGGQGGTGGRGGKGGKGGPGGLGGNGGPGGHITVTIPGNFIGVINHFENGGPAGLLGDGGPGGPPGASGSAGTPGNGGTNLNCSGNIQGATGPAGTTQPNLGFGDPGDPGTPGNHAGANGDYTENTGPCVPSPECSFGHFSGYWDAANCQCEYSPILIDVNGTGIDLTDVGNGVRFDMNADGNSEMLSWTSGGSDDAWLALDRNGDGQINDGKELFGNFTPQPAAPSNERNGFRALAEYDKLSNGGNADGVIDTRDAIFVSLRLWQDLNHNGVSELSELQLMQDLGIVSISLDYREAGRTDQYGNRFRFRGKVEGIYRSSIGRWAWDVYLLRQ